MFKFKNISSDTMKVICEEEDNSFLVRASHRFEEISIDGRNGSIINDLGYSLKESTMKLYITKVDKLNDILSWLNGVGELEYKNRVTKAYFLDVSQPKRSTYIKTLEIGFRMDPFWYKANDTFENLNNNKINNDGNCKSYPIIRIEKTTSNSVEFTINDINLKYTFDDNDTFVEIDCLNCTVTYNNINKLKNLQMGYEFPFLNPGENIVSITSGDGSFSFKRKDCWL